jgi:hypothetical protein
MNCQCGAIRCLSFDDGMAMQESDLLKWAKALKASYYQKLACGVYDANRKMSRVTHSARDGSVVTGHRCGHDVCRGGAITEIFLNLKVMKS